MTFCIAALSNNKEAPRASSTDGWEQKKHGPWGAFSEQKQIKNKILLPPTKFAVSKSKFAVSKFCCLQQAGVFKSKFAVKGITKHPHVDVTLRQGHPERFTRWTYPTFENFRFEILNLSAVNPKITVSSQPPTQKSKPNSWICEWSPIRARIPWY